MQEQFLHRICPTRMLREGRSQPDLIASTASIERLRPYLTGRDRSLVFFVGAGASMADNTGMPSTPTLLYQLFLDSLMYSGVYDSRTDRYKNILRDVNYKLGFEITLNDFWQICPVATSSLYSPFAELEQQCLP